MTTVGLFGFGRTGRNLFRLLQGREDLRVGAISDIAEPEPLAYLARFDTLLGRFPGTIALDKGALGVDGRRIPLLTGKAQTEPPRWGELGVDTVFEATQKPRTRAETDAHLAAGARRVILLAPPAEPPDATIVRGVNHEERADSQRVVSISSATVHAVAPLLRILHGAFGIRRAIFTTVHAYTSAHRLADVPTEDKRQGRAAAENIIPQVSLSAEAAVRLVPELSGRVSGYAMNVPVSNGSVVDLVCWHERPAARDAINEVLRDAAAQERWRGVIEYETDPIVSSDVLRSTASAAFDSLATMTLGDRVSKTLSWFGAGLGHAQRAIDLAGAYAAGRTLPIGGSSLG